MPARLPDPLLFAALALLATPALFPDPELLPGPLLLPEEEPLSSGRQGRFVGHEGHAGREGHVNIEVLIVLSAKNRRSKIAAVLTVCHQNR